MKKIGEAIFVGTVAFISGWAYEQGRKAGKGDYKITPEVWAAAVGSRLSRDKISKLIKEAKEHPA